MEKQNSCEGYVYILINPSLEDNLLKIGMTTRTPQIRAKELSGTGIPHAYHVAYYRQVSDCRAVEKLIHNALEEYRYEKEFFKISLHDAIEAVINLVKRYEKEQNDKLYILNSLSLLNVPYFHFWDQDAIQSQIQFIEFLKNSNIYLKEEKLKYHIFYLLIKLYDSYLNQKRELEQNENSQKLQLMLFEEKELNPDDIDKILIAIAEIFENICPNNLGITKYEYEDTIISNSIHEILNNADSEIVQSILQDILFYDKFWGILDDNPIVEICLVDIAMKKNSVLSMFAKAILFIMEKLNQNYFTQYNHENEFRELLFSILEDDKNSIDCNLLDYIPKILIKTSSLSSNLTENILTLAIDNIEDKLYQSLLYDTLEAIWEEENSFGNLSTEILVLALVSLKNNYDASELFERIMSLF